MKKFYEPVTFDPNLKADNVKIIHIPATNPRPEHDSKDGSFPIPENHTRGRSNSL